MNATVAKIVDLLFAQNTDMTPEVQALQDELMNNCQERFEDLVAHGSTEDEAIGAVVESLKGMEEVIDAYPKKTTAQPTVETASGTDQRFDAAGIVRITFDARSLDLTCEACDGDNVRVLFDDELSDVLTVERAGDTLRIHDKDRKSGWWTQMFSRAMADSEVRVLVPRTLRFALESHTLSGDVSVEGVAPTEALIASISGDIELSAADTLTRLDVNTASGDVEISASADSMRIKTMSGDIGINGDAPSFEVSSVSGDVSAFGGYQTVALKSVSGDVSLRCADGALQRINAVSTSGDVHIALPASVHSVALSGQTTSGDLRCTLSQSADGLPIQARTVSGDVNITRA